MARQPSPRPLPLREERAAVARLAAYLGWPKPTLLIHREVGHPDIRWYESNVGTTRLQVNVLPPYRIGLVALPHRIHVPFMPLTLSRDDELIRAEAGRLCRWFLASWFESPASRRRFRNLNPDCAMWTAARLRAHYGR